MVDEVYCLARRDRDYIFYKMNDAIILVFFLNDVIELPCKFMEIATENSIATPILFVVGSAPVHKKWNVARCDKTIDKLLLTIPIYYHFTLPIIIRRTQYNTKFSVSYLMDISGQAFAHHGTYQWFQSAQITAACRVIK